MWGIAVRTVIIYFFLLFAMRMMGGRELGQLELSELVTALLLSEVAIVPVTDTAVPLSHALVPAGLLLTLEFILPSAAARFPTVGRILDGRPQMIVQKGKLLPDALRKCRITPEELLGELRLQGVGDIGDVDYAILEPCGKLSLLLKGERQPLTPLEMGIKPKEKCFAHPIVMDGQVSDFNLTLTGHDRRWLREKLREKRCRRRRVLLYTIDDAGKETLVRK